MSHNGRQRARSDIWRRVLRIVFQSLAWGAVPHFVPRYIPLPDDGPALTASREPECTLSRAERRTWAEIEAHYR